MTEIVPFDKGHAQSSVLKMVYETTKTGRRTRYRFLGYLVRDGKQWIAITQKPRTPDSIHDLQRDAIEALR